MTGLPVNPIPHAPSARPPAADPWYWLGLPFRWAYQMAHNGHGIARILGQPGGSGQELAERYRRVARRARAAHEAELYGD